MKALIIEDDPWLSDTYVKILHSHGWQTATATNASSAIDIIDDFMPDVLLLDFILPLANAPALLHELQSHNDLADLPVVLCTTLDMKDFDSSTMKKYGVRAVLNKTDVQPSQIVEALTRAVA